MPDNPARPQIRRTGTRFTRRAAQLRHDLSPCLTITYELLQPASGGNQPTLSHRQTAPDLPVQRPRNRLRLFALRPESAITPDRRSYGPSCGMGLTGARNTGRRFGLERTGRRALLPRRQPVQTCLKLLKELDPIGASAGLPSSLPRWRFFHLSRQSRAAWPPRSVGHSGCLAHCHASLHVAIDAPRSLLLALVKLVVRNNPPDVLSPGVIIRPPVRRGLGAGRCGLNFGGFRTFALAR